jgi:hypothetical protein
VAVEFAPIAEEADGAPPAVAYIQKMSDTKLIVGFDEPIAAGTVKPGAVAVGAAKVVSVAYNEEGPSLGREIVVETEPLAAGKAYPLAVTGIADTFGNAVSGATVEYVARPGAAQRTPFISRWLTIGKWPADYEADFVRAADCRPSPGDVVKGLTDAELTAHMKKFVSAEKYEQLTKRPLDEAVPRDFGGDKKWIESRCRWAASVLDFIDAGHGKRNLALAFAHTYVWSDRERDVMVRLDSNSGHRAWLNGRVISDEPMGPKLLSRGMHDRTNEIAAKLDKGWNRLLVGVDAYLFSWSLSAQITDMHREPIRDLTYQLEAPKE